jgi:hypothetical protein
MNKTKNLFLIAVFGMATLVSAQSAFAGSNVDCTARITFNKYSSSYTFTKANRTRMSFQGCVLTKLDELIELANKKCKTSFYSTMKGTIEVLADNPRGGRFTDAERILVDFDCNQ